MLNIFPKDIYIGEKKSLHLDTGQVGAWKWVWLLNVKFKLLCKNPHQINYIADHMLTCKIIVVRFL